MNSELIRLYWKIGKAILEKQKEAKWGDKILENLSRDLSEEFPDKRIWHAEFKIYEAFRR